MNDPNGVPIIGGDRPRPQGPGDGITINPEDVETIKCPNCGCGGYISVQQIGRIPGILLGQKADHILVGQTGILHCVSCGNPVDLRRPETLFTEHENVEGDGATPDLPEGLTEGLDLGGGGKPQVSEPGPCTINNVTEPQAESSDEGVDACMMSV